VAPPGATRVVWTSFFRLESEPSAYTLSKISPMTWNDDTLFGPPTPK